MIAGVIQKKTMAELAAAIAAVDAGLYDLLELRLDACTDLSIAALKKIVFPLPVLFTLRAREQGGAYLHGEEKRLQTLSELMALQPAYIDLESSLSQEWIERLRSISPATQIVLSYHDFNETPKDLQALLARMREKASGVIYKIATFAQNTVDALRMLVFCKEAPVPVLGICMGADGETTRILAPVVHGWFTYCPVSEATAPGQLDAVFLRETYRVHTLNRDSAIFGLLGDPVEQSIGHVFHNRKNQEEEKNAVYVKWRVTKKELPQALSLLHRLGVQGLSVTMPLKETLVELVDFLDAEAKSMGAVNTLTAVTAGWHGSNTDAAGALRALGAPVDGKRVVVLGAGGAGRAIVQKCLESTQNVRVFNRTPGKKLPGGLVAAGFSALSESLEEGYDIIINTLPFDQNISLMGLPFVKGTIAMDISYGAASQFLQNAMASGCRCIDGTAMYVEQALLQRTAWG